MAIEYPEAVIISGQMRQVLPGRSIVEVVIPNLNSTAFRWGFSNLDKVNISGEQIRQIRQHGDYLYVDMQTQALVFGDMIGKILYHAPGEKRPPKATILIELDDEAAFSFNPSLYGYCSAKTPEEQALFHPHSWVEPLEEAFTPEYLARALAEPERKIAKQMNVFKVQYKAHGVGNGYWQEILYLCGVHPQRKAREITPAEIECLHAATRRVMAQALAQGGSAEEKDFFGSNGNYVRSMGGRLKGQPCQKCGTTIEGKSILGANVYFCPLCQK